MASTAKSSVLGGLVGVGALVASTAIGLPASANTDMSTTAAPIGHPWAGYGSGGIARIGGLPDEVHEASTTLPNGRLLSISTNSGAEEVALRMLTPTGGNGGGFGPGGLRTFGTAAADEAKDVVWSRGDDRGYAVATSGANSTIWGVTRRGGLDNAFGSAGVVTIANAAANRVAVDDAGRVVVAGSDAAGNAAVWRFHANGSPDTAFGSNGVAVGAADSSYDSVAVDLDGSLFLGASGETDALVTKLTAAGAPASFGVGGTAALPIDTSDDGDHAVTGVEVVLQDVHRQSGSLPVVSFGHAVTVTDDSGEEPVEETTTTAVIERLTATGAADPAFTNGVSEPLHDPGRPVVLVDGQQIVVPGASDDDAPRIIQLTATGAAQTAFGGNGVWTADGSVPGAASNMALQPDGTYLASGQEEGANAFVYAVGGTAVPTCAGQFATIVGLDGGDTLIGSMLDDVIVGGNGADNIRARAGDDRVCGGDGPDVIKGGAGNDRLNGNKGRDTISGGSGDDIIKGGKAADDLRGGAGNDVITGGKGPDSIRGGKGDDDLRGGKGRDTIRGGPGNDTIRGGQGRDILRGGAGDDTLYGGKGRDQLFGGKGNDRLYGGPGRDILRGGPGNNLLVQ